MDAHRDRRHVSRAVRTPKERTASDPAPTRPRRPRCLRSGPTREPDAPRPSNTSGASSSSSTSPAQTSTTTDSSSPTTTRARPPSRPFTSTGTPGPVDPSRRALEHRRPGAPSLSAQPAPRNFDAHRRARERRPPRPGDLRRRPQPQPGRGRDRPNPPRRARDSQHPGAVGAHSGGNRRALGSAPHHLLARPQREDASGRCSAAGGGSPATAPVDR